MLTYRILPSIHGNGEDEVLDKGMPRNLPRNKTPEGIGFSVGLAELRRWSVCRFRSGEIRFNKRFTRSV